ncbi:probable 2-oxoglutarate-dependent dioxygenase SLC1 [Rhodamnia argentea]|uniref:Probable 2-oxoglutarate-dependent dioxygenase SLC1 n=1 Tax=Rhodamnia argentea TaxID=178133 RepID=A0A8B8NHF4_9MYRT|nr:probable 2-oxoglutarate-dependent dioxygenase SLC1 [Rhodamnia argentea]
MKMADFDFNHHESQSRRYCRASWIPSMGAVTDQGPTPTETQFQHGVKHLHESGLQRLPTKYVLPLQDRPKPEPTEPSLKLPVVDLAQLRGPARQGVITSIADACKRYGFFQVVNHGVTRGAAEGVMDVGRGFFGMPFEERAKYMSADMSGPVRCGTSFNQRKDDVFCWRDFLKLTCQPMPDVLTHWPASPADLRKVAATYAKETRDLFLVLMEAILEGLHASDTVETKKNMKPEEEGGEEDDGDIMEKLKNGSQLMVVNYFPPCPEPDLTLGLPPHSDYGFLTLLLQDEVEGLQIQFQENWVTVEPIENGLVVNLGDHLEIFSNGRYKSVLHRVLVNSERSRISVASLHSLPNECMVRPSPKLIDRANPRRYKDTDFGSFLEYISSRESKKKNFLETRKLT